MAPYIPTHSLTPWGNLVYPGASMFLEGEMNPDTGRTSEILSQSRSCETTMLPTVKFLIFNLNWVLFLVDN